MQVNDKVYVSVDTGAREFKIQIWECIHVAENGDAVLRNKAGDHFVIAYGDPTLTGSGTSSPHVSTIFEGQLDEWVELGYQLPTWD